MIMQKIKSKMNYCAKIYNIIILKKYSDGIIVLKIKSVDVFVEWKLIVVRSDCSSQFRYMVSPLLAASGEEAVLRETLSWRALERKSTSGAGEEVTGGVYLPGGGIALPLLRQW